MPIPVQHLQLATASVRIIALIAVGGIAVFMATPCIADDRSLCTGDRTACDIVKIIQQGTDQASGGHVVIQLTKNIHFVKNLRLGMPQEAISMELLLAGNESACNGNHSSTPITLNKSDRGIIVIPGYLCEMKAAWEAR
jgi:hypothetical protein